MPEKLSEELHPPKDDQVTIEGEIGEIEAVKSNYSKRLELVKTSPEPSRTEMFEKILKQKLPSPILAAL